VDRARDLIGVSGFTVFPAEVEDVIRELPDVVSAAVIGRPDPRGGELVVAFVVGPVASKQVVLDHCAARLVRFKQPAEVHLVAELPRGVTGKIKKGALRRMTTELSSTDVTATAGPGPAS